MCNAPCKIVLIVVNIAAFIVGVALMAVGGLMTWGQSFIQNMLSSYLQTALGSLGQTDAQTIVTLVQRILTTTGPLGLAIFIVGGVITCIAVLGFVAVCCCGKVLLYIYAALMGVIAIAVLAIAIFYFVNRHKISAKLATMYGEIVEKYVSLKTNDDNSLIVLFVQGPLKCCGSNNYTDFKNMAKDDIYDGKDYTNLKAPVPCCMLNEDYKIADATCPGIFDDNNSNWKRGCSTEIQALFEQHMNTIGFVLIGIFLFFLAVMIVAILAGCCS